MRLSRLLLFLFIPLFGLAQRSQPTMNIRACDTLIMQGHYARAARCLQPHYNANPQGPSYEKLLDAYLLSSDTSAALKLVRRQSKRFGDARPKYTVDYWVLSRKLGKKGPLWTDIEVQVVKNPYSSRAVARVLERYGMLQEAVKIYELAERQQPKLRVAFDKAQLYAQLGEIDNQYSAYIQALEENKGYLGSIKLRMTQNIGNDEQGEHARAAKEALIRRIEQGGNVQVYETLLLFILRELDEYQRAFKWLSARSKINFQPSEFIATARTAHEDGEVDIALAIFEYLIYNSPNSKRGAWLNNVLAEYLAITATRDETRAKKLCEDFGGHECGICFKWELAREEYLFRLKQISTTSVEEFGKRLELLRDHYSRPSSSGLAYASYAKALQLSGDFDRALIEYARAETLLGDSKEGDQARLSRAMCSFYSGDILWAKTQLEVLLKSTSKEVANDALETALLIASNSIEDTAMEGLQILRKPMLYEAMERYDSALVGYENVENILLANETYDDLLYRKGKVELKLGHLKEAERTFRVLQNAAGEGMWKEEAYFYFAQSLFLQRDDGAESALEDYLIRYPNGFYTEQARIMYRTFTS